MEAANWGWPGYDQGKLNIDHALFHYVLPRMLAEEDPTRYYQPSSPFSPDGLDPGRDDVGDQHPWSIGFTDVDFRKYREMACRFPNEGGIFGPTALPTVRACLERESDRPGDHAWDLHENGIAFWGGRGHRDLETHLWLGKTADKGSLRDYVYRAGLVQGEGLAEYIKNFRRRMFDSASAVFWMYNDCWPAVRSWTIVDYYLRRTPSFHPVRRAFAPRTVVVTREGEKVRVYGVNDGPRFSGRLRYGIMRLSGGYPVDEATPVTLEENASTLLAEYDARAWDRLGVKTHVAFALLADDMGTEVARDRMIIPLFKEMKWPRGQVGVSWTGGKAVFTSRTFAWRVCLDLDGEKRLPDNFFDVWPGVPTVLPWPRNLGRPAVLRTGNR
jgi:beta-mannosidase